VDFVRFVELVGGVRWLVRGWCGGCGEYLYDLCSEHFLGNLGLRHCQCILILLFSGWGDRDVDSRSGAIPEGGVYYIAIWSF
jgi:hypothetical protein